MPYRSEAQRKYFNANRKKLSEQGVDVDHWNKTSKGKKLPERSKKAAYAALLKMSAEASDESSPWVSGLRNLLGIGVGISPVAAKAGYNRKVLVDPSNKRLNRSQGDKLLGSWFKSETERGARSGISPDNMGIETKSRFGKVLGLPDGPTYSTAPNRDGPHYDPDKRRVFVPGILGKSQDAKLGILAHELGHAEQFRKSNPTNASYRSLFGGRNRVLAANLSAFAGGILGTVGPTFEPNKESARNQALVGTAMFAPQLASEVGASARGSRTLMNYAKESGLWQNKNALEKLKYAGRSWTGMPTYLLMAALPIATYLGSNLAGSYNKDSKQSISEELSRMLYRKKN